MGVDGRVGSSASPFDAETDRQIAAGEMPVSELVNTVIQESRHAYQQYAVESTSVVADASVMAVWADNLDNYMDATIFDQELYETQPIEAAAWSYAARICQALYDDP
jgi:hypothetical protein